MGYAFENLLQGADFYWIVIWNDFVMLSVKIRCQPDVRAFLPSHGIS
jgi:hypothetical protein